MVQLVQVTRYITMETEAQSESNKSHQNRAVKQALAIKQTLGTKCFDTILSWDYLFIYSFILLVFYFKKTKQKRE